MCEVGFDGDACTVWDETERTSRKDRRCNGCLGWIRKGERYVDHRSLFDGEWSTAAMCLPCRDDRTAFVAEHGGLIPHPTALKETIAECADDGAESERKWASVLAAMEARCGEAVREVLRAH